MNQLDCSPTHRPPLCRLIKGHTYLGCSCCHSSNRSVWEAHKVQDSSPLPEERQEVNDVNVSTHDWSPRSRCEWKRLNGDAIRLPSRIKRSFNHKKKINRLKVRDLSFQIRSTKSPLERPSWHRAKKKKTGSLEHASARRHSTLQTPEITSRESGVSVAAANVGLFPDSFMRFPSAAEFSTFPLRACPFSPRQPFFSAGRDVWSGHRRFSGEQLEGSALSICWSKFPQWDHQKKKKKGTPATTPDQAATDHLCNYCQHSVQIRNLLYCRVRLQACGI